MPEAPPPGCQPVFLKAATCSNFGLKTGDGITDYVEYKFIKKELMVKDFQNPGSCFFPIRKLVESYPGDQLLFFLDREEKYGENFVVCYTEEAKDEFLKVLTDQENALKEQLLEEARLEEERKAAEYERQNAVFKDEPLVAKAWNSTTSTDTETEIKLLQQNPSRELLSIEVTRPKRFTKQSYKFFDRNADIGANSEFKSFKDSNFKGIKESDLGIQVAPTCEESAAQTTWFRSVNKAVQYEAAQTDTEPLTSDNEALLLFLERATIKIENALQQNESVDIFHETFRFGHDDENLEGTQAENELRELKNFADPTYSKFKALVAIDWVPKAQGMVAVSAVRNISFDQRIPIIGQTHTSYVLLWDFRLLVKPLIIMQSHHEIFTFRFNKTNPNYVAGGCITGQVVLWEVKDAIANAQNKNNRGSSNSSSSTSTTTTNNNTNNNANTVNTNIFADEEEEYQNLPISPKYVSNVDYSHKRCVADLFWLPPTTQINYRGQLVSDEHLTDHVSHQFITVAGDGMIMVWDTRFEQIFNDELRHIGRAKHVPTEKTSNKDSNNGLKPLWSPIFKAHLKRLEGVGELSLCKVCETAKQTSSTNTTTISASGSNNKHNNLASTGDARSQFIIATEEGDIILADLSAKKGETTTKVVEEEEEGEENEVSCVKWIAMDHPRPCVCLQESPFFPQIILSVSDWNFHLWKLGEDQPLFSSPLSNTYLTAGAWSLTRPAVLFIACADGQVLLWDFTDTSFRPSMELKATHSKITSMEFLSSNVNNRYQLLAVGDEVGTLHIFDLPRNLTKPVHKEETIMAKFLERELQRIEFSKNAPEIADNNNDGTTDGHGMTSRLNTSDGANDFARGGGGNTNTNTGSSLGGGGHGNDKNNLTGTIVGPNGEILSAAEEAAKAEKAALQKEEDEYLKLESIFISELGLSNEQLPVFMK